MLIRTHFSSCHCGQDMTANSQRSLLALADHIVISLKNVVANTVVWEIFVLEIFVCKMFVLKNNNSTRVQIRNMYVKNISSV